MTAFAYKGIVFEAYWDECDGDVTIVEVYHGEDNLYDCFDSDTIEAMEIELENELKRLDTFAKWEARKENSRR